jgi:glc operon protein GlcG
VRKLDSDGVELWSYRGHDDSVRNIAVDSQGNVYTASKHFESVSASDDAKVRKLDEDGVEIWSFKGTSFQGAFDVAVDPAGFMVMFQRLENTQLGSIEVATEKARSAALFRRPTKVFQDAIESGGAGLRILKLPAMPLEGGVPIIKDGKVIGAVGVSGVRSDQDAQVAEAGIKALTDEDE